MQEAQEMLAPRRERKKQQTRDALLHAALELFQAKGYDQTAVREITDAVDVSERTFFRYFASKEDLALTFIKEATTALLVALAARPPDEPPLTALKEAFRISLREITVDHGAPGGKSVYLCNLELIESTPSLLAAHLRYLHDHDGELISALAKREGIDPATDRRPLLVASMFAALASVASKQWRASGADGTESLLATFDAYAAELNPALFGRWG
jgi:AcrR family transcriptional regulator